MLESLGREESMPFRPDHAAKKINIEVACVLKKQVSGRDVPLLLKVSRVIHLVAAGVSDMEDWELKPLTSDASTVEGHPVAYSLDNGQLASRWKLMSTSSAPNQRLGVSSLAVHHPYSRSAQPPGVDNSHKLDEYPETRSRSLS